MDVPNGDSVATNFPVDISTFATPTLSEIAEALQEDMQHFFHELQVDIASCPCLTREPFNLLGVGLCGNTSIIEFGDYPINLEASWPHLTWDIRRVLSRTCHDSFVIGTSYAAKPHMPYNGHLIMNAMYRAPMNITNASRIVFANTDNRQRRIETVTNSDQMICSYRGSFFVSEGRTGNVLRVRAKGRRLGEDIITSMQAILHERFGSYRTYAVALGGVLRMRHGLAAYNIMSENYPEPMLSFENFIKQYQYHETHLESDLIAVGTIFSNSPRLLIPEPRHGHILYNRREFHSFSNYGAGGQFINDITPDTMEYEGYFNLANTVIRPL